MATALICKCDPVLSHQQYTGPLGSEHFEVMPNTWRSRLPLGTDLNSKAALSSAMPSCASCACEWCSAHCLRLLYALLPQATCPDQHCSCAAVCRPRLPCCRIQPCKGGRCRVPGTRETRKCKRADVAEVAAQTKVNGSTDGNFNSVVDGMLKEDHHRAYAIVTEEYYYTYEEAYGEASVQMSAV